MPALTAPLRFEPFLRPMVWGGRRLQSLEKRLPDSENYGESWELSDHSLHRSVVAAGPWKGKSLRELMEEHRSDLLGKAAKQHQVFPWLFKFLDARDWLSVQVHPDEASVSKLWPGEGPKNEAWFVLDAAPDSRIYAGLLPGIGRVELLDALSRRAVEEALFCFKPMRGDFLYLPAGTVHAVGGGVLLAEIQQTSDATFRLFDWNRRDAEGKARKLHVAESLACIDWTRGPNKPLHIELGADYPSAVQIPLVATPYFKLTYTKQVADFVVAGTGELEALCVFGGKARLQTGELLKAGQVWLWPAAMERTTCRPEPTLEAMRCLLP